MRAGQQVVLVSAAGVRSIAVVAQVTGAGASGYKTLDVQNGGEIVGDVPHVLDRVEGSPFWAAEGDVIPEAAPADPVPTEPPAVPVPSFQRSARTERK